MCKKRDECRALIALLHHQSSPDHADEPGKGDRSFVGHVDLRDRDGYGLAGPTWKEPKRRRGIWSGLLRAAAVARSSRLVRNSMRQLGRPS
jgi:hypothetical protein